MCFASWKHTPNKSLQDYDWIHDHGLTAGIFEWSAETATDTFQMDVGNIDVPYHCSVLR